MDERAHRRFLLGALTASLLIMLGTAAAVTAAVLLDIDELKREVFETPQAPPAIEAPEVSLADAGDPRTFLILGSDERYADKLAGRKPRSDTILLVRANPRRKVVTVMSIPRDLRVVLPSGRTDKINGAYEDGGPRTVLRVLRDFVEQQTGEELRINHVLNVDFRGFRRAVNYIGGVYADIDRDYFNDNMPPRGSLTPYATIDVAAGYQRLKGQDALDYVRYRHGDDDFLRAARQQDFLRQIARQPSVRRLLRVQDRHDLARVFGSYIQTDRSFRSTRTLLRLLKLGSYMQDSRIVSVRFPGVPTADGIYVETGSPQLQAAMDQFLRPAAAAQTTGEPSPRRAPSRRIARRNLSRGMEDARAEGRSLARRLKGKVGFPFLYPAVRAPGSRFSSYGPNTYRIAKRHRAYRLVLATGKSGDYYGIQGTEWRTPPILARPDRVRRIAGKRLLVFFDGRRTRLVGFRTDRGAYWVSNTLTRSLSNREMLAVAASLRR